jgi:hypothetical protein
MPSNEVARVTEEIVMDLGPHAKLLAEEKEAQRMAEFWSKRRDKLRAEIEEVMGDATIGTIDGSKVVVYEPVERFRGAEFRKLYPDTYQFYTREVTKTQFDEEWFRASRPDLYEQFRVRPLKNTFEV